MAFQPYNPARVGGQLIDKSLGAARDADIDGNNVFEDWIFPQRKEQRQFGQELALMYNEPKIRMQAMKEAGINPLTAAGAIAGSSPSSTPQPSSSVNPIGDVAGAVGTAADAFNSTAGAISTLGKLSPEISNIKSDTAKNFADIGLTNEQTQGVMTDNKYKDEDWRANLDVKRQQFDNMKAEWDNLKATHEQIKKSIDEMQAQIDLSGSQQDQLDAMKNRIEEETRFIKEKNDFCLRNKLYLLDSGIDGYIFSMIESGADMSQFNKFVDTYSNYREQLSYHDSLGRFNADSETAWKRFKNQAEGTAFGELVHGKRKADLENYKTMFDVMCQLYFGSGSTETALLTKIFNLAATMFKVDVNDVRRMFLDATNPQ